VRGFRDGDQVTSDMLGDLNENVCRPFNVRWCVWIPYDDTRRIEIMPVCFHAVEDWPDYQRTTVLIMGQGVVGCCDPSGCGEQPEGPA